MFHIEKRIIEVLQLLNKKGKSCVIGGYIRDKILSLEPQDIDLVTTLELDDVKSIFPNLSGTEKGLSFGVGRFHYKGLYFEISSHPQKTIEEIANTRDFSFNALYFDENQKIIDSFDGISDLNNKIIQHAEPFKRHVVEHPQAFLRALRLSAKLGFVFSEELLNDFILSKDYFFENSANRIQEEGYKILSSSYSHFAFYYLQKGDFIKSERKINLDPNMSIPNFNDYLDIKLCFLALQLGKENIIEFINLFQLSKKLEEQFLHLYSYIQSEEKPKNPKTLNKLISFKKQEYASNPQLFKEFIKKIR